MGCGVRVNGLLKQSRYFYELPDYPALVDIADDMDNQLTEIVSIRLPESLMIKIEQAIIEVRRHYPAMEGVKSNVVRASIMQRLLREPTSVTEVWGKLLKKLDINDF